MNKEFDIVGDIHGQSEKLIALLHHLGYKESQGAWRHPHRIMRFVGDFVDRGPGQLETLQIVRGMLEAGSGQAIMGNHEFNAIAYATRDPDRPKHFLRIRGSKNRAQHASFLEAVGVDSSLHQEWIKFFYTLPLWLEDDHMRMVHACWHEKSMQDLSPLLGDNNTLTEDLIVASSRKGSREYVAVEALCKGMEVDLPPSVTFTDQQGVTRSRTRTRWWDENAHTFQQAALLPQKDRECLPKDPLPKDALCVYDNKKPLFFGHYWMSGTPSILSNQICCVDYSAARDPEPLVAYRFDGEEVLSNEKIVSVLPNQIVSLAPSAKRIIVL